MRATVLDDDSHPACSGTAETAKKSHGKSTILKCAHAMDEKAEDQQEVRRDEKNEGGSNLRD